MFKDVHRLLRQITVNVFVVACLFYLSLLIYYISFKYGVDQGFFFNMSALALANLLIIVCFIGYVKEIKGLYYFSLVYTLFTSFMSLTDDMGTLDLIVLILSALLFVSLISQIKRFMYK